jgi:hypothetical protein
MNGNVFWDVIEQLGSKSGVNCGLRNIGHRYIVSSSSTLAETLSFFIFSLVVVKVWILVQIHCDLMNEVAET